MKILILPDIHGRTFWKKPCENPKEFDLIIFLGDYLDPYESIDGITKEEAYNNFKEILEFINTNSNVIPLIGNHDWHYFVNLDVCRMDKAREHDIEKLFKNNISKFKLTYTVEFKDIKYLFSHAGITNNWLNDVANLAKYEVSEWKPLPGSDFDIDKDYLWIEALSKINETYDFSLLEKCLQQYDNSFYSCPISMISRERGGWYPYGSCIWADIREHLSNEKVKDFYQIFGHTYAKNSIIEENFAMLDSGNSSYILDENKNIIRYE